jgi:peroxiredoxin Q/BCP
MAPGNEITSCGAKLLAWLPASLPENLFVTRRAGGWLSSLFIAGDTEGTKGNHCEGSIMYLTRAYFLCRLFFMLAPAFGDEQVPQVGDLAPDFQCLDDDGEVWKSRDHIGKEVLVIQFYPSDFAFNCTQQAQRYRDAQMELVSRDAIVIGISGDAVRAHRLFKAENMLNFTLLADGDGGVARKFGVPLRVGGKAMARDAHGDAILDERGRAMQIPRTVTAARWTFIIGKDGRIIYRETAGAGSREALEFLTKLSAK